MAKAASLIISFWEFFITNCDNLFLKDGSIDEFLWKRLSSKLKAINADLCFEIDLSRLDLKQFIISADGIETAFDYVDLIYRYKPQIKGWNVIRFRQPLENLEEKTICVGEDIEIKFSDIQYFMEIDKFNNSYATLLLFIPQYKKEEDTYETLKWLVLDAVLGEYDAVKKINYCAAYSLDKAGNIPKKDITKLRKELNSIIF